MIILNKFFKKFRQIRYCHTERIQIYIYIYILSMFYVKCANLIKSIFEKKNKNKNKNKKIKK